MKIVSAHEMRAMDASAPSHGISGMELMENAASFLAEAALPFKRIGIFCGKGNNGGDGFAAARLLFQQGKDVTVIQSEDSPSFAGDAEENFNLLKSFNIPIIPFSELNRETPFDAIIDCLLGTGLHGEVTGTFAEMIEYINKAHAFIISADIPSGVESDTGKVESVAVRANLTVTFAYPKKGHFLYPGRTHTGTLTVVDIGMPPECNQHASFQVESLDFEKAASLLPPLSPTAHKGDMGRVLTVGGSIGMAGAAYLSTQAAVKSGAGLVTLACPSAISEIEMTKLTEAMVLPLPDRDGIFASSANDVLALTIEKQDAILVGCGMKNTEDTALLTQTVIHSNRKAVLDADALNTLCGNLSSIHGKPLVLTPHLGEFARLSGFSMEDIMENRLEVARNFAHTHQVTLVLKGADTIIASPDGDTAINTSGNPGMATGGSGDVLAGTIAALLAAKLTPYDAARLGVYTHGLAGDMAAYKKGLRGMTAVDILEHLPYAFYQLEKGVWSLC